MPSGRGRQWRRRVASLGARRAAAAISRPHHALWYRLSFDHGWQIVEEYQLNYGTTASSSRAIAAHFADQGVKMSALELMQALAYP